MPEIKIYFFRGRFLVQLSVLNPWSIFCDGEDYISKWIQNAAFFILIKLFYQWLHVQTLNPDQHSLIIEFRDNSELNINMTFRLKWLFGFTFEVRWDSITSFLLFFLPDSIYNKVCRSVPGVLAVFYSLTTLVFVRHFNY